MALKRSNSFQIASLFFIGSCFGIACSKNQDVISITSETFEPQLKEENADGKFPYKRLSTYGFFEGEINKLQPTEDVILYEPASSLFTDYAIKSRFVHFSKGTKAQIKGQELDLPIGTTLIKNFYHPEDFRKQEGKRRIIETRLMIHAETGWEAYPYIWNDSQTDAILKLVGGETKVEFIDNQGQNQVINYLVPNKNQCKSCHNQSEKLVPIGVKVSQLNHSLKGSEKSKNQLANWTEKGVLEGFKGEQEHPVMADYEDSRLPIQTRAMAYLDINCAHCHQADGPASTSGLFLTYDQKDPLKLGINKTPVAAGIGAGKFKFDIAPGKADQSIMVHRMNSTQVGVAMPEIGRTTIHQEGVELIRNWINSME
jgi:uncharacterized repeat protein (TIGR03806 family)